MDEHVPGRMNIEEGERERERKKGAGRGDIRGDRKGYIAFQGTTKDPLPQVKLGKA